MNTYLYEVTFKKGDQQTYEHVRAHSKADAAEKASKMYGDITIVSISRIGN